VKAVKIHPAKEIFTARKKKGEKLRQAKERPWGVSGVGGFGRVRHCYKRWLERRRGDSEKKNF